MEADDTRDLVKKSKGTVNSQSSAGPTSFLTVSVAPPSVMRDRTTRVGKLAVRNVAVHDIFFFLYAVLLDILPSH